MADTNKRKQGHGGDRNGGSGKRRQGGSGGKWQTPHAASRTTPRGGSIDPGDAGIWATCMKSKEGKATQELKSLFDEYAERLYGIKSSSAPNEKEDDNEEEEGDIEDAVKAELSGMKTTGMDKSKLFFEPVFIETACVLFWKTRAPIVPTEFIAKICEDAAAGEKRKCRFVNRLTPMTEMGKANESGLKEVGRRVLSAAGFDLAGTAGQDAEGALADGEKGSAFSYAIRTTIRNHSLWKRDAVIPLVANLVSKKHKVNLSKPDKVIVVEIYQSICGISVVQGPSWEGDLKRFNLFEIYEASEEKRKARKTGGASAADTVPDVEEEDKKEAAPAVVDT